MGIYKSIIILSIFLSMLLNLTGCSRTTSLTSGPDASAAVGMPAGAAVRYLNKQSFQIKGLVHKVSSLTPAERIHFSSVFRNRDTSCTFHEEYIEYRYDYSWKRGTEQYDYSAIKLIHKGTYIKETVLLLQTGDPHASLADVKHLPRRCMIFFSSDDPLVNDSEIQQYRTIKSALHALGVTQQQLL
jgi:hypothetical protein